MEQKEVFFLFLVCIIAITILVAFALAKGVDGVVFGSGTGALCIIAGYVAKTLRKPKK